MNFTQTFSINFLNWLTSSRYVRRACLHLKLLNEILAVASTRHSVCQLKKYTETTTATAYNIVQWIFSSFPLTMKRTQQQMISKFWSESRFDCSEILARGDTIFPKGEHYQRSGMGIAATILVGSQLNGNGITANEWHQRTAQRHIDHPTIGTTKSSASRHPVHSSATHTFSTKSKIPRSR